MIARLIPLAACLLSAGTLLAVQLPTFRAAVSLVRIDVLVTDRNRPVLNLAPHDFEVLDNGIPQEVESVFSEAEPLDVLFTFDRSGSVRGETLRRLKEASRAALDLLAPADRAGLMTFDHSFLLEGALTTERAAVRSAIDRIEPGGATALLDTVYAALTLAEARSRRTLVLLFTDGWDSLSWLSEADVLNVARESDAVVYAVAHRTPDLVRDDDRFLGELTEATGGRVLWVDTTEQLTNTFVAVIEEMRSRYLLTYSPAGVDDPGWHTLSVRLKGKRGRVAARQGYFLEGRAPQ